jgi:STE24 endopeptidase
MYVPSRFRLFLLLLALGFAILPAGSLHAQTFDPVAATDTYLASLPEAERARSDAYFEGGYWLILWNFLYTLAVMAVLLWTGLSARLRDLARRIVRVRWLEPLLYGPFFAIAVAILSLPIDWYEGFWREHEYGLSNQDLAAWAGDHATEVAVNAVASALVLTAVYAVVRAALRSWWIWGSAVTMVFAAIFIAAGPVFIEPLFNHYTPLPPSPVRDTILSMARADGVPATEVYEVDASRQSKRISANVSGFLGTTRIALNDNLMNHSDPDEIAAVMGHEMGHYVMNHIGNILLDIAVILLVGFAWSHWSMTAAIGTWGRVWRVDGVADVAGFPAFFAAFSIYLFVLTPVLNTLTRQQEMQADIFGLNLARQPDAFARVALQLAQYRKLNPSPLEEFIFFDHPSGHTRILTAMTWKAERLKAAAPDNGTK